MAQEGSDLKTYDQKDSEKSLVPPIGEDSSTLEAGDTTRTEAWRPTDDDGDNIARETENIKGQIEETRNQMGETIDAIQDKLSFSNISEQVSDHVQNAVETAKDAVYGATIGKAADIMKNATDNLANSSLIKTAKNNPLPFILIGAGAGLLAYKSLSGTLMPERDTSKFRSYRYPKQNQVESPQTVHKGTIDQMSEKLSTTTEMAIDKVSTAFDSASASAAEMKDRVYDRADEYREIAMNKYDAYLNDNPLALGAAALALGAAVGMAIPATMYESELMGETRDNVMGKAQESAAGLLDKTKKAIMDAGQTPMSQKGSTAAH